jgi:hypothetical protein
MQNFQYNFIHQNQHTKNVSSAAKIGSNSQITSTKENQLIIKIAVKSHKTLEIKSNPIIALHQNSTNLDRWKRSALIWCMHQDPSSMHG